MSYLIYIAWGVFGLWVLGAALTLFVLAREKSLRPAAGGPAEAPFVSVLVPARNEEGRVLAACVRSILAQDYPGFEVVAVNDRSTDATGQILRELAEGDQRLRVIEGAGPPAGWLGKPYALQQALEASRGGWVVATDADIIFHPATLRTAVAHALSHGADALSLIPHFEAGSFWERVFVPTWAWGGLIMYPPELVNHPKSPLAVGVGAFYLIERAALNRIEGFGAVRADVLDDIRLAEKLKASGARARVEYAPDLLSTRMYTNFAELWAGSTRNWFAILRFSLALTAATILWISLVALFPWASAALSALMIALGLADEAWRRLFVPSFLSWLLYVALYVHVNRRCRVPAVYALAAPLGWVLSCVVTLASAYRVLTGKGVAWKGRQVYDDGRARPS